MFPAMPVNRIERVNELLHREIGEALYRVMTDPGFDMSAVTVTHVMTSRNLRHAQVLVSIRADEDDKQRILSRIGRHRAEIQQMINRDLGLKYTPRLTFLLDRSLEQGDHVLSVLEELERNSPFPAEDETEGDVEIP